MRIMYISDLHIDSCNEIEGELLEAIRTSEWKFDVLVIAGDVANYVQRVYRFFQYLRVAVPSKPIIFVPGNHEYYNDTMKYCDGVMSMMITSLGITVLGNNTQFHPDRFVDVGDETICFIGGTLWTDFEVFGNPEVSKNSVSRCMNDFRRIVNYNDKILTPDDTSFLHESQLDLMENLVMDPRNSEVKFVAVSHHGPSRKSIAPEYLLDLNTPAFTSGILDVGHNSYRAWASKISLWIHGHTHAPFDYDCDHGYGDKTRVVCNPLGYSRTYSNGQRWFENTKFDLKVAMV